MTRLTELKYAMVEDVPLERLREDHPVRYFAEYWQERRGTEKAPRRALFSPAHMPQLLPFLVVLEYVERGQGPDFLARLEGEYVVSISRMNSMGRYLSDFMSPAQFDQRCAEFLRLKNRPSPIIQKVSFHNEFEDRLGGYRGVFPFLVEDGQVGQLFIVVAAEDIEVRPYPGEYIPPYSP
tara:strand:+ start:27633 stop:28172 length:540 start_codon:yes stop_codon:yes gene_type:complete